MADPIVTALTAVTKEEIWPRQITDSFFRAIPFFSYIRDKALITFSGMTFMQYPYLFRPMIGGAYAPGSAFNIDKVDSVAALSSERSTTKSTLLSLRKRSRSVT